MRNFTNRVELIGNLGGDPEVKKLDIGKTVANISLATHDTFQDKKGRKVEETQWHRLVAWESIAEEIERQLKKGDRVAIEGKLVYRTYEDKEGIKRFAAEVIVSKFLKLSAKDII